MSKPFKPFVIILFFLGIVLYSPYVYAGGIGLVFQGVARIVGSVLQVPIHLVSRTAQDPFPIGLVTGTLEGAFYLLAEAVAGTGQIAAGAAPYAKYLVFLA